MDSKRIIQDDILRYKKNKLASTFTLLGLVFTVLYFALLYSINKSFFYSIFMGFSIIVTLVLLLVAFLSSESIKNYRKGYCITLLVLAAINILRIFYYPLKGLQANAFEGAVYFWTEMSNAGIFTCMVIYLVASAACYIVAAVFGYIYAVRLEKHEKAVAEGKVDLNAAFNEAETEEVGEAAQVEQVSSQTEQSVEQPEEPVQAEKVADDAVVNDENNSSSGEVE